MSVFLRRSVAFPYLDRHLSRPLPSTSLISRSANSHAATLLHGRPAGKSATVAQAVKTDVSSGAEELPHARPEEPRRNLLKGTKVQNYLDHIASTSREVTLADIERYRPSKHPSPRSPKYEEEYNALVETLVRSFSLSQLRKFLGMYHLKLPARRNKWETAVAIIEHRWDWPSMTTLKEEKRDWTEVVRESFPLDARQSFLILGKDGADLLSLSTMFNARVSLSANPLSLKVEGLRGTLNNLRRHIEEFKAGIQEQLFQLPSAGSVEPESLRRISRMSGAFVEHMGHGLIRISYRCGDDRAAHYAKRLVMHAATNVAQEIPTLVHSTPSDSVTTALTALSHSRYALYPFFTAQSEQSMRKPANFFRIRSVADWPRVSFGEAGGLTDEGAFINLHGEAVDLRHSLLSRVASMSGSASDSNTVITASFGHLVFASESQRSTIAPPLNGILELPTILRWLGGEKADRLFVSSLPPRLNNASPARQHLIHRLVYHSYPTEESDEFTTAKILKFELVPEVLHPLRNQVGREDENDSSVHSRHWNEYSGAASFAVGEGIALKPKCWTGIFNCLDLMMPERPMDIRLSISSTSTSLEEQWPKDLQDYSNGLRSFLTGPAPDAVQPLAPLTLVHGGETYRLESSSTVRQSWDTLPNAPCASSSPAIIESILDSESNQRTRVCMLSCNDIASDESWTSFLSQCDHLSAPDRKESVPNRGGEFA
ncbi:putative mitochondrial inner-membrane-bound regulator [Lyophyllum shimeji]|uniref:Mitochondrial inner-membrane-bound regulator n=1 Tax=Lyophyllum shimeji TaxID=47721 RepID=A0A9P3UIZ2_LYOSH|nr:putative mitochondrial inner-membrane-bound regulator [Lyophyllum shimeji]